MKLRLAKKICSNIEPFRYSEGIKEKAHSRMERTKSSKEAARFWHSLMNRLGVEGRAEVLTRTGATDLAFGLLMREEW
jgi:hypothetical protein